MKKILVVLLTACVLVGCQSNDNQIGIIIPLTGAYSDVGQWMRMGIDFAIEDLSAEGIDIKPFYEDSQSSPSVAISSYQKLKTMYNVEYYISTVSSVCLALKPLIQSDGNFLFVNAGHKDLINENVIIPSVYRHALTIPQEALFLAQQIKGKEPSRKTIALLYTNNDIGVEFQNVFKSQFLSENIEIHCASYEEAETNLKSVVQKLNNLKPDIYVIYGYTKNFAQLIKTIREQSFYGSIYANQGFSTPSVIENSGSAGNNVFYSDYDIPCNAYVENLNKRSLQKYNEKMSPMAIASYDIMYIIGKTLSHINENDIESFKETLSSLGSIEVNGMNLLIKSGEVYIPLKLVENVYKD